MVTRMLERVDAAASTIVPLRHPAGMVVGTARSFSSLVLDAGVAVGVVLAVVIDRTRANPTCYV